MEGGGGGGDVALHTTSLHSAKLSILLMTLWNAACMALVSYFLQSDLTYLVKKNGNNKITECLSNDSTVFISVLSSLCKEFHIVYNCYQFE